MTTPPSFPVLPGQSWSVHKRPSFSTRVASHVSGREVRSALYADTLYEFELTYDGLASDAAHAGLAANSLQSLLGFYLQCQGQFGTFLYTDPTDQSVAGQVIGTGNGTQTSFTLQRSIGGYAEPVSWVPSVAAVYLNGIAQPSGWSLVQPNTLTFASPPLGAPTGVFKVSETASTGQHLASYAMTSIASGSQVTLGIYVQAAERSSFLFEIFNGVDYPSVVFDIVNVTRSQPSTEISAATIKVVGGGWVQCLVTFTMAATSTPVLIASLINASGTFSYAGIAGNGLFIAGPTVSINGSGAAYLASLPGASGATVSPVSIAPPGGVAVTADFSYAFVCRFIDDQNDFENFMQGLWKVDSLKFRSVKP